MVNKQEYGCYYCKSYFPKEEIKEYVDDGKTPLCPLCNIDSVVNFEEAIQKLHHWGFEDCGC